MTTVALLVCGSVLIGLALIFLEPFRDPSWLFLTPSKHPTVLFWVILLLHILLTPSMGAGGEDDAEAQVTWGGLIRIADLLWAVALGMLFCLMIVADDQAVTGPGNVAAYIACGLALLSVALRWRDRHEKRGFRPDRNPTS